jgi:stearoyl-CoA desaturase (delta-9 desaturase)
MDDTRTTPRADHRGPAAVAQLGVTLLLVVGPIAALVVALVLAWGHGVGLEDLLLLAGFFLLTGFGITAGFHRLLTHRSYTASRPLRWALTIAGSLAFQGGVLSWVATHRRHHAYSDRPGDPHSPRLHGASPRGRVLGAAHAHFGWLLRNDPTSVPRYAPDLADEPFMRVTDRLFPAWCLVSLGLPMLAGYLLTFTVRGMLLALLWAGLVRVCLLQQITWSVNSLCHLVGQRPFTTRAADHAANVWPIALISMGDSWHNYHHSDPTSARHGVLPRQIDATAGLIRGFERLGWASNVHWPDAARVEAHRRPPQAEAGGAPVAAAPAMAEAAGTRP